MSCEGCPTPPAGVHPDKKGIEKHELNKVLFDAIMKATIGLHKLKSAVDVICMEHYEVLREINGKEHNNFIFKCLHEDPVFKEYNLILKQVGIIYEKFFSMWDEALDEDKLAFIKYNLREYLANEKEEGGKPIVAAYS